MAGLEDLHGAVPDGHEAEGDMEIGDRPRVALVDRRRRQIIIAVLLDGQLDLRLVGLISLVDAVLPALRDLDDLVFQRHGPGRIVVWIEQVGRAVEIIIGIQVGVGLDGVDPIHQGDLLLLLRRQVVVIDQTVVQVGHDIVGLLAGPDLELNRIGPVVLQGTDLGQVPGDAVLLAVGGAGRRRPDALDAVGIGDVVGEGADHAVRVVGRDGGKARYAVVHHDVRGSEGLRDLLTKAGEQVCNLFRRSRGKDAALLAFRHSVDHRLQTPFVCGHVAVVASGVYSVEIDVGTGRRDGRCDLDRFVQRSRHVRVCFGCPIAVGLTVREEEDVDGILVRRGDRTCAFTQTVFPVCIAFGIDGVDHTGKRICGICPGRAAERAERACTAERRKREFDVVPAGVQGLDHGVDCIFQCGKSPVGLRNSIG